MPTLTSPGKRGQPFAAAGDLDLGGLDLTELLDTTIGDNGMRPKDVRVLRLHGNQLRDLSPAVMAGFVNLHTIDLSNNEFTEFPAALRACRHLTKVNLDLNRIHRLRFPSGHPVFIRSLSLRRNGLIAIEPDLNNLQYLEDLDVGDNLLGGLPGCFLSELREFRLDRNPGLSVGGEVLGLPRLTLLDLSSNGLTNLDPQLAKLPPGVDLRVDDNFLDPTLANALEHGIDAARLFIHSIARDGVRHYEAKVVLVGEGNVGKTSLVEALRGNPFVVNRPTTHGIEINTMVVEHPDPDVPDPLTLRTWDFGGQEVYRVTHQFFFSPNTVYLIVWRPREGQEENAVADWIRRIRLRIGRAARILVVATHGDERQPELDFASLRQAFGDVLVGTLTVDSASGLGIQELASAIRIAAAGMPHMGSPVSERWLIARDQITAMDRAYLTREEFDRCCADYGALEDDEIDVFLSFLHQLGYVVYFGDDDGLRNFVVLQPEWLTKAISYVLEDRATRLNGGMLDHRRLEYIWLGGAPGYPRSLHPYFLRLMEKFDVSYRVEGAEESLVAQLLPYERPDFDFPSVAWDLPAGISELRLQCRFSDDPLGLMPWLIVRNQRFADGVRWRRGMVLRHPVYETEGLIELGRDRTLTITVVGEAPRFFFNTLRDTLEYLCATRWPGLQYEIVVPCKGGSERHATVARCTGLFPVRALEKLQARGTMTVTCLSCVENVSISSLLDGFDSASNPINELRREVGGLRREITDQAAAMRSVMRAFDQEVTDCPRLVSIAPTDPAKFDPRRAWQSRWRLALWCEEHGSQHEVPPAYTFTRPREWFVDVAPYLRIAVRIVGVVAPIVGGGAKLITDDQTTSNVSALIKSLGDAVSVDATDRDVDQSGLTRAEGAALRRLRELLLELDPNRGFADLRRVRSPTGQYLWLCPEHFAVYEPNLPSLPYPTGPVTPSR
ncbi:COR domain-containing protein [Dactylosporangium sp. NPDC005572]|uniref:COR domain-containing protein n=1 Tax=Dactylosporangium sp. NPDC005572 TaxID=3156889 RepID=UPI0033B5A8D2